jgi:hypothetical protein
MNRTKMFLISLLCAFLLTFVSFLYQRVGPIQAFVGTECGSPDNKCFAPALNGGFPFPYVIDQPTLSVPNSLFFEDDFRLGAFLLDMSIYLLLVLPLINFLSTRLKRREDFSSS